MNFLKNIFGKTNKELLEASRDGDINNIIRSLDTGADIESKDGYGDTSLVLASEKGNLEVVKVLIERGANIDAKDRYGLTPLLWALERRHNELVEILLERGANIESKSNNGGWTPLILASEKGNIEMVKVLLEKGANIEVQDNSGWTPLIYASRYGKIEVVKILLEKGAYIDTKDDFGLTALDHAVRDARFNVISVFKWSIRYYLSFHKLNKDKVKDYSENISGGNRLFIKSGLISSHVIFFFLTKLYVESDKFRVHWSRRGKKVIFLILLEELDSNLDLNLNNFFVCHFNEKMSSIAKENSNEKNRLFVSRLIGLSKTTLNKKMETISSKFSSNIHGEKSERFALKQIEVINSDEVIIKTINRHYTEKIIIIDWKKNEIIAIIGNADIQKQVFSWINHLNQIFCYQKRSSKLIKESKCYLFSKIGHLIKSVYSIDNSIHEVNSIFYDKNNLQVYLNVFNLSSDKRSILILSKEFNLILSVDEDLFNPDFPWNYSSEIKLFNINYKMFHYNSNIAFLQLKDQNKNVYIFDKSSYSIVDSLKTNNTLIMVSGNKMLFKSRSCYLIQKVPLCEAHNFPDFDVFCKLNPLKKPHFLTNSYLLPCGNSACLECIYQQYNLFKQILICRICNQVHRLPIELEPVNKWVSSIDVNEKLFEMSINESKKVISHLDERLGSFEKTFEYMEHLINVRIESLKMELDNNELELLNKINKFIRSHVSNQKVTKSLFFKINDHRRNKKLKINSKKIGFICRQINKKFLVIFGDRRILKIWLKKY